MWCPSNRVSAKGRNPFFATWAFAGSGRWNCVLWHCCEEARTKFQGLGGRLDKSPVRRNAKRESGVELEEVRTRFRDFGKAPGQKTRSQGAGRNVVSLQPSECQRTQPLFRDLGFCRIRQMELRPLALLRGGAHQIPGFWEGPRGKAQVAKRSRAKVVHGERTGSTQAGAGRKKGPTRGPQEPNN